RSAGQFPDRLDALPGQYPCFACQAVEKPSRGRHVEGGGLLVVERAQSLEGAAARVPQLQVLAHHLIDGRPLANRCDVLVADSASHCSPPRTTPRRELSLVPGADIPGRDRQRGREPRTTTAIWIRLSSSSLVRMRE